MLTAIIDPKRIRAAQLLLEARLNETLPQREGRYMIGHQGGSIEVDALLADHRIWFVNRTEKTAAVPRYWNAFGLADQLNIKGSNHIAVEINIPLRGLARRVAGLFAEDSTTGNTVLLHRGKVGGGREGIGKSAFLEWYRQDTVKVHNGDSKGGTDEVLLVADLSSPEIAKQIGTFVMAVSRFKEKTQEDEISTLTNLALAEKVNSSKVKPKRVAVETLVFVRNIYVVEYVKRRARGICDLCEKKAPFSDATGKPYLECHHVEWLADGGSDTVQNAVALCPNCHRRMHILKTSEDVARLREKAMRTLAGAA